MTSKTEPKLHASCVAIDGAAILITGPSGAGKSDLALRLIDRGAVLVSDDYVRVRRNGDDIIASPPEQISGKLEVRALGIVDTEFETDIPLRLKINLDVEPERFPMDNQTETILGKKIPSIKLNALESSAPIKVEWALARAIAQ